MKTFVIAVDGPAASGKGTIAKALAKHYGLPHLDTGLLFRAVGWQVAQQGGNPDDPADALKACEFPSALLAEPRLRDEATGGLASRVSVHAAVREALYARQRAFALQPGGAVLDGRDIGTVIAPEAPAKLYVTATPEIRAERRWKQLQGQGEAVAYEDILGDIRKRDARDGGRADSPMRPADDSVLLDTSEMTIEQATDAARRIVEAARARWERS